MFVHIYLWACCEHLLQLPKIFLEAGVRRELFPIDYNVKRQIITNDFYKVLCFFFFWYIFYTFKRLVFDWLVMDTFPVSEQGQVAQYGLKLGRNAGPE